MLLKPPLQAAARPEASLLQSLSGTSTAASSRHNNLLKHAANAAAASPDEPVGQLSAQLPGIATPVMRQLQQSQQQLQEQLEQARLQLQHQQQQRRQTLIQLSKPALTTSNSSGGPQRGGLSPDIPVDPMVVQQLRDSIAAATTIQQLLQFMPATAADKNADSVARVLLQAVQIQRSSNSSSRQDSPLQLSRNKPPQAAPRSEQHTQQQLHQLLQHCDNVLLQCHSRMMFQHVSAVLWSWAQLEWKPGSTVDSRGAMSQVCRHDSQLLCCVVVDRLKQCTVQHELSGKVPHAGAQLARAVTACAKLNIHDRKAWAKLHTMIETLSDTLSPIDVACCIWGLARSGQTAKTLEALPAYRALMLRAQKFVGFSQQAAGFCSIDGELGFTRVGSLNVIWGVCTADLINDAPTGLLVGLMDVVLGQQYSLWRNQQQQQQEEEEEEGLAGQTAAAAGAMSAAIEGPVQSSEQLLPHEMSCLVWSLAVAARHSTRWTSNKTQQLYSHNQHQQHRQYQLPGPPNSKDSSFSDRKSQQPTQACQALYEDLSLLSYLVKLVGAQLASNDQSFGPRQIATLAYGFALLLRQQQQQGQFSEVQQQLLNAVVGLWFRALEADLQHDLAEFKLAEVHMLLQSVAVVQKLQQQQQQQQQQQLEYRSVESLQVHHQQLMPARITEQLSSSTTAAAAVLAAACQRVLATQPSELQPRTAAGLLYVLSKLQDSCPQESTAAPSAASVSSASTTNSSSGGSSHSTGDHVAATSGGAAAVAVKLLDSLSSSSALAALQDQQMVMMAVAAGQLAAGSHSSIANTTSSSSSSSSSSFNSAAATRIHSTTQPAALSCLNQLSLQLAAAASDLKLRELATTVCAYATAQHAAPQLFDAVSQAVQQREILDHGSTWGLARLLAAYASVHHTDEQLFAAVVDALLPKLGVMQPRALARFAWALAESGYHDLMVFRAVGAEILQRSGVGAQGNNRGGHNTAADETLASNSSITHSSRKRPFSGVNASAAAVPSASLLKGFQARDVSALVWASGTVGHKDPRLYDVLSQTAVQLFDQFSASQLASLLWGLAAVGFYHKELINKVTTALSDASRRTNHRVSNGTCSAASDHVTLTNIQQQNLQQQAHPQQQQPAVLAAAAPADVSTLAWSLGELRCLTPGVLLSCAVHFSDNAQQYSSADAADLAWTVITSGWAVQLLGSSCSNLTSSIATITNINTSSSSYSDTCPCEASSESCDSVDNQGATEFNSHRLLQQLLMVVLQDLEQLTPQQLANTLLVTAVVNSAAGLHPSKLRTAGQVAASSASNGTGQQRQQQQLQLLQKQLVSCITGWGPGAFSAGDGVKLLWAQLMLGQPLAEQQRHQQQQKEQKGQQSQEWQQQQQQGVVLQKLLSAGARAAVRHTASVCSSSFCQEVTSVLNSIQGVTARPVLPSSMVAAKVATQAAHAAVAAATAVQGSMVQSEGESNKLVDVCPAGSTAGLPPTAAAAGSDGVWRVLGAEVTAQLLGHVVVTVDGGAASSDCSSSSSREVLLQLVPDNQLLRAAESTHGGHAQAVDDICTTTEGTVAATAATLHHDAWLQQLSGGAAVAAGLLLQQQACYTCAVIVTEAQWQQWAAGGQEAQAAALKHLVMLLSV